MLATDPRNLTLSAAVGAMNFGWKGSLAQEHIPHGWATVAELASDAEYVGPIREENTDWIVIDVFGSDMTFSRDRVIVTYPL